MESLIKAGAFDKLAERNQLLSNLETLLEFARENLKLKAGGQKGLFDNAAKTVPAKIKLREAPPASKKEMLTWEKDLLGLFVSSHPLEDYRDFLMKKALPIRRIHNGDAETLLMSYKRIRIGGIIVGVKKIVTKTGRPMLFMDLEDLTDRIEVVVFPNAIEKSPELFQENKIVFISGRVNNKDGEYKMICEEINEILEK
jgi:DNA polymerase-3 subunit alpha